MARCFVATLALVSLLAVTADARPGRSISGRSLLQGSQAPSQSDPILDTAASAVSAETMKDIKDFISGAGNSTYEANMIATAIANATLNAFMAEANGSAYSDTTAAANAVANAINTAFINAVGQGSNNNTQFMANAQAINLNATLASALLAPPPTASDGSAITGKAGEARPFPFIAALKAANYAYTIYTIVAPLIKTALDKSKMMG